MNRLQTALLLIALLLLSGCNLYRTVPVDQVYSEVSVHDTVRITTTAGKQLNLTVVALEETEIVGREGRVPLMEIERLEKRPDYDPWHVLATIGALVTALILA
ncbi:MAG: hypothetical protein ACYTGW_12865 [Planctomycetota bacterium]|jgi:hypothetical protein